jgi:NAD(P) transhydrogenase
LQSLPNAIAIYGGGVIACEYATVFATLGVGVTLICREENFLPFLEKELRDSLKSNMKKNHVLFVEDDISAISLDNGSVRVKVSSKYMKSGKELVKNRIFKVDIFLYSGGRDSNSDNLGLENVAVSIGKYGRIIVDTNFKTTSNLLIYAVGDVIGPPMLASSAQAQARRLSERLFAEQDDVTVTNVDENSSSDMDLEVDSFFSSNNNEKSGDDTLFGDLTGDKANDAPLTLWSIPEISSVGLTYENAVASHAENIFQGYAYFKDTARGRLSGTADGYLKIVSKQTSSSSHVIVGVHIFGEGANELIQMGALLIHSKTTLQQVSKTPFAAVTMTGLFQIACDDILRQVMDKKD